MMKLEKSDRGPLLIYVAGPYTPDTDDVHDAARIANRNVESANLAGIAIIRRGHYPLVPHLWHYMHIAMDERDRKENDYWYGFTMALLRRCDALYYLGKSKGADNELTFAKKNNMTIFRRISDIPIRRD
jgi:hypothetical protein